MWPVVDRSSGSAAGVSVVDESGIVGCGAAAGATQQGCQLLGEEGGTTCAAGKHEAEVASKKWP